MGSRSPTSCRGPPPTSGNDACVRCASKPAHESLPTTAASRCTKTNATSGGIGCLLAISRARRLSAVSAAGLVRRELRSCSDHAWSMSVTVNMGSPTGVARETCRSSIK
eukprot:scaffold13094_cov70-Phaeocystis_antarctica.AAC.3